MKKLILFLGLLLALPAPGAALDTEDLLSLVAMPLAVAAVADLIDVPPATLVSVVSALNQAEVPPAQFIEVVRYVPVVLVDETTAPQFVTFVTTQVQQGVVGDALAVAIAQRLRDSGVREINVTTPPRVIVVERNQIIPAVVVTRVAKFKRHPHGGPPGQLKKIVGVQTGAEIVHGTRPGDQRPVIVRVDDDDEEDRGKKGRRVRGRADDPRQVPGVVVDSDRGKDHGKPDHGKGKGKGKGKDR